MNYLREINTFYDWLETNSLSHSAINLWHALMHINNKTGWITEFTVAISTLENKTGLKKDAITGARLRLQQANRISFKSRGGNQSATYTIIPFESFKPTQSIHSDISVGLNDAIDTTTGSQVTPQSTAQVTSINKLNKTALNDSSLKNVTDLGIVYNADFETFWNEYPKQVEKIPAYKTWQRLMESKVNPELLVICAMNYADYCKRHVASSQYIKHPHSFLDEDKYREYINPVVETINTTAETVHKLYKLKIGKIDSGMIDLFVKHYGEVMVRAAIESNHSFNYREQEDLLKTLKAWEKSGAQHATVT